MNPLLLLRRPGPLVSLTVHGAAVAAAFLAAEPPQSLPPAAFVAGAAFEAALPPAAAVPLDAPTSPDLSDALPAPAPAASEDDVRAEVGEWVIAEPEGVADPAASDDGLRVPADLAALPLPLARRRGRGAPAAVEAAPGPAAASIPALSLGARAAGGSVPSVPFASNRPPAYPEAARARGVEGTTWLRITVRPDGTVEASIERSSGDAPLDEAALEAARRWRYASALRDGVPAFDTFLKAVRFRLR